MNEGAGNFCFRAWNLFLAPQLRRGIVYRFECLLGLGPPCFSRSTALLQQAARVFRASHAGPLPGVLFLPPCGEAAGWTYANDETSPSLARQPNEKSKGDGSKDNERQRECDANLEPLRK